MRDLETLRTAHDVEVARLLKDNEYARMEHAQRASMWKKETQALEEALDAKGKDCEALEAEVRETAELKARCASLATEAETSRRARDDADTETEKARQSLKMHAGVTEKLERRIHVLQGDVEARDAEMTRLNDKIAEREAEAVTLQTRLDELAFKHRADLKLAHAQAAKDRAELESEFAIEREEAEALLQWEAGKAAREAEADRLRHAVQAQREREAAVGPFAGSSV